MKNLALLLAAFAAVLAILAAGLRPDAFFVGDPGVKLIAARNAIAHPTHPLNIPLPTIGGQSLPYIEPFFEVHNDHAHAITSDLFPLVSAPLIDWFGMRGAYMLPALGFLGILAGCAWLALTLDPGRNPLVVAATAGLATPFLFYGLEFWEHAPAVALATVATAMYVRCVTARDTVRHGRLAFASGLVFGVALLLRPEVACVFVAVLVSSWWLEGRTAESAWRLMGLAIVGATLPFVPLEIYTIAHFSRVMPSHIGANSGLLRGDWIAERLGLSRAWLFPSGWTSAGPTRATSFWSVAPAAVLAFLPLRSGVARSGRAFLWAAAAVTVILVLLTAPNDGGGQWGPRYLLFAYVPLVVLAADTLEAFPLRKAIAVFAVLVMPLGCLWMQRSAYRQLRGAKVTYGRVVDFVAGEVAPGGYVVTDLWWLDQAAAAATSERRLVYAPDTAGGHAVMQRLSEATVPIVSVIRSRSESPDVTAWVDGTCYVEIQRTTLPVRDLVAIRLHHRCSK